MQPIRSIPCLLANVGVTCTGLLASCLLPSLPATTLAWGWVSLSAGLLILQIACHVLEFRAGRAAYGPR